MRLRSNIITHMEESKEKHLVKDEDEDLLEAYENGNLMIIEDFSNNDSPELKATDSNGSDDNESDKKETEGRPELEIKKNDVIDEKDNCESKCIKQIEPDTTCASPQFRSTKHPTKCANVKPTVQREKCGPSLSPISDDCCIIHIDTVTFKHHKQHIEQTYKTNPTSNTQESVMDNPTITNDNSKTILQNETPEKNKKLSFNPKKRLLRGKSVNSSNQDVSSDLPILSPPQPDAVAAPTKKIATSGFKSTKSSQSTVAVAPYQMKQPTTKSPSPKLLKGKIPPHNSDTQVANMDRMPPNPKITSSPKVSREPKVKIVNPAIVNAVSSTQAMVTNSAYNTGYNAVQPIMVQSRQLITQYPCLSSPLQPIKSPKSPGIDSLKQQMKFTKLQSRHIYIAHYIQIQRQKYQSLARLSDMPQQFSSPSAYKIPPNHFFNPNMNSVYATNPSIIHNNQPVRLPFPVSPITTMEDAFGQVGSFYYNQNLAKGQQLALSKINNPTYTPVYPFTSPINQKQTIYKPTINYVKPRVVMNPGGVYSTSLANPFTHRVRPNPQMTPLTTYTSPPRAGFICQSNFRPPIVPCLNDRSPSNPIRSSINPIAFQNTVFKTTNFPSSMIPMKNGIDHTVSGVEVSNPSSPYCRYSPGVKRTYSNCLDNGIFTLDQPLERADNKSTNSIYYPAPLAKVPRQNF